MIFAYRTKVDVLVSVREFLSWWIQLDENPRYRLLAVILAIFLGKDPRILAKKVFSIW